MTCRFTAPVSPTFTLASFFSNILLPEGELPSAERFFRFGASKPRKHSVMNGCYRPRLCKKAGTVLKSALLRKICKFLINQQT